MSDLQAVDIFNMAMGLGLVVLLFAIRDIERCNTMLHARNLRERKIGSTDDELL